MIGQDLPALAIRRPLLVLVLNLLIALAGLAAILGVEVRELPDIDRPIVTARGNLPGASPETVDVEATAPVEGAVARVAGVREVRSSSEEGNFRIRVVFSPNVDLDSAAGDVREAVSRIERRLDDHRAKDRRDAEDQRRVRDAAPDHVAHREAGRVPESRVDADGHLRERGPESDHDDPDDKRGDAKARGKPYRRTQDHLPAREQEDEPG